MMELEFGRVSSDIFSKVEKGVEYLLKTDPKTRDDDMLLAFYYWRDIQRIDIPDDVIKKIVKSGTAFESISRCRRLIQEKGFYSASPAVMSARMSRADAVSETIKKRKEEQCPML